MPNCPEFAIWTFFLNKVLISETVRDKVKQMKIWDHKGDNMQEHHTFKIGDLDFFSKKVLISESVTDNRVKWKKIWDHKGHIMQETIL